MPAKLIALAPTSAFAALIASRRVQVIPTPPVQTSSPGTPLGVGGGVDDEGFDRGAGRRRAQQQQEYRAERAYQELMVKGGPVDRPP